MGMGPGRWCGSRSFFASVGQLYVPQMFFYIHLGNRFSQWGAHKRKIIVILCDKTGGFFYDSQTQQNNHFPLTAP